MKETTINLELGVGKAECFNEIYFDMFKEITSNGTLQESRNGNTIEVLDFKTIVTNPRKRCVGGYGRDINVFFLLAEALWIWSGRNDVKFLDIFNSQLKQYSDDGVVYHAPYGFRMRKFDVRSSESEISTGFDQLSTVIRMLDNDHSDRRAVIQIWNARLDLGVASKDIPCNDMWMLKIRDGKLHTTIQNRSNDLNLGLTTNIFQFSFLSEIIANMLGVELGNQTHNSQSLHVYSNTILTEKLKSNTMFAPPAFPKNLYDSVSESLMDFDFSQSQSIEQKQQRIDFFISSMITLLIKKFDGTYDTEDAKFIEEQLLPFSKYLYFVFKLLELYVLYKSKHISKFTAIAGLLNKEYFQENDITILARNFFVSKLSEEEKTTLGFRYTDMGKY